MTGLLVAFLVGAAVGVLAARRLPGPEHRQPGSRFVDEPAARAFRCQLAPWPTVLERRPPPRLIWPSKFTTPVGGGRP